MSFDPASDDQEEKRDNYQQWLYNWSYAYTLFIGLRLLQGIEYIYYGNFFTFLVNLFNRLLWINFRGIYGPK